MWTDFILQMFLEISESYSKTDLAHFSFILLKYTVTEKYFNIWSGASEYINNCVGLECCLILNFLEARSLKYFFHKR